MSTMRIAAATSTETTTGAIVPRSDQFIARLPSSADPEGRQEDLGRRAKEIEYEDREEPEQHDQERQRSERYHFSPIEVGQMAAEAPKELGQLAEGEPLEHPQQVSCREDHDDD